MSALTAQVFTRREAAAMVELPEKRLRKELELGIIEAHTPPRLGFAELVYLRVLHDIDMELSSGLRAQMYRAIRQAVAGSRERDCVPVAEPLNLRLGPIRRQLRRRVRDFARWKARLVVDSEIMGGEAVFPGSRLTVRHVGEMLERGEAESTILEDYPYLNGSDLEKARLFVQAYPRVGRPPRRDQAPHRRGPLAGGRSKLA
jgi:uncharacterized protein (DUF433 family)